MAGNYFGRLELLDVAGNVVDSVDARLQIELLWGGQIAPTEGLGVDWGDVAAIRLENGVEAAVNVTKESIRSAETATFRTGQIVGSGSPPF
jgi:hypothetical protein